MSYILNYPQKAFFEMTHPLPFNIFAGKSWQDKVLEADALWLQIKTALAAQQKTLPTTPRRPDVRLIVANRSGAAITFKNPGDHSGGKEEIIPADGAKTAAMIMIKGATLAEQHDNARFLYDRYQLGDIGLSTDFIHDLTTGVLSSLIDEAYGPAPLDEQASKLVDVTWQDTANTPATTIQPVKGTAAAFGARAATQETVFLATFHIYVKGSTTTPELIEGGSIAVAVASDWQTGAETTRPIAPSVARIYYGQHFDAIPVALVHPDGMVKEVRIMPPVFAASTAAPFKKSP